MEYFGTVAPQKESISAIIFGLDSYNEPGNGDRLYLDDDTMGGEADNIEPIEDDDGDSNGDDSTPDPDPDFDYEPIDSDPGSSDDILDDEANNIEQIKDED